jgi:hypothetical protein
MKIGMGAGAQDYLEITIQMITARRLDLTRRIAAMDDIDRETIPLSFNKFYVKTWDEVKRFDDSWDRYKAAENMFLKEAILSV